MGSEFKTLVFGSELKTLVLGSELKTLVLSSALETLVLGSEFKTLVLGWVPLIQIAKSLYLLSTLFIFFLILSKLQNFSASDWLFGFYNQHSNSLNVKLDPAYLVLNYSF